MKRSWPSVQGALWATTATAVTVAAAITQSTVQLALAACLVLVGLCLADRLRILWFACLLAPFIPLLRRVVVQRAGDPQFDPLALVPLVLTVVVVVFSAGHDRSSDVRESTKALVPLIGIAALSAIASIGLGGGASPDVIYGLLAVAVPTGLALGVGTGRIPDVWLTFEKWIVPSALVAGAYGVFQFLALPSWDSSWMVTSGLASIGAPEPYEVRVFGVSESPGPFASFIGLALVVAVARALRARDQTIRLLLFLAASLLVIPLVLTGVRTALIGCAACMIVLSLTRSRGIQRLFPVVLLVIGTLGLNRIIGSVAGKSSVLVSDRYSSFDAASDDSVQARLSSLGLLLRPLDTLLGRPSAARNDNLILDLTVNYGTLCGLAALILLFGVVRYAFVNLVRGEAETASISVVFIAVFSLSGNIFLAGFGVIAGAALGATILAHQKVRERQTDSSAEELASPKSMRVQRSVKPR